MQLTATCPNCGSEITFRYQAAVQTTCEFCKSILVRHDKDLEAVGVTGEWPLDPSPIMLGTRGSYKSESFEVVGRILYGYELGGWNEWHIILGGKSAWLSDAQLEYAISRRWENKTHWPDPKTGGNIGMELPIEGTTFRLTSITQAKYIGVEGDLPFEYWDKAAVTYFDLRSSEGKFATIDYSETPPVVYLGESCTFDDLQMTGLREFDGWKR